jgi:hypothetical protein
MQKYLLKTGESFIKPVILVISILVPTGFYPHSRRGEETKLTRERIIRGFFFLLSRGVPQWVLGGEEG